MLPGKNAEKLVPVLRHHRLAHLHKPSQKFVVDKFDMSSLRIEETEYRQLGAVFASFEFVSVRQGVRQGHEISTFL